ncbi:hypothetical protein EBR66_04090 [bacterium]|nr:hypothetical protein [bacterium]
MAARYIVFDIETVGSFSGPFNPLELEMTICCTYDSKTGAYDSFLKEDLPRLWKLFEHTDVLVGYNSDHFDIPILNKYYPGDLLKMRSLDIMKEVQNLLGRRLKLDSIAEATLGAKKIGSGSQAPQWWKEGKIDLLREYCTKDVELTKKVFEYALAHNALKYKDLSLVREVRLNTTSWLSEKAAPALTHTLGF